MSNSVRRWQVRLVVLRQAVYPQQKQDRGAAARAMLRTIAAQEVCADAAPPLCARHTFGLQWCRAIVTSQQWHPPVRFLGHLVVLGMTLAISVGEGYQSWSQHILHPRQAPMPQVVTVDQEEPGADELVSVIVPLDGTTTERLVSGAITPAAYVLRPNSLPVFEATHTLVEGETLGDLAARYGVSLASLIWANGLETGDVLAVGQELRIPRISGVPYVIQAGDTFERIATRFAVVPEAIWLFEPNMLRADSALPVGQEIFIPGGVLPLPEALLGLRGGELGLAATAARPAAVVREPRTNMRTGPGAVYPRVAQFDAGRQAELLARHAEWLKVDVAGTTGWMRADLLDLAEGMFEQVPETSDFPPPPPIWVWPTYGGITSPFGPRWGGFHNGLDVANRAGTPIVAARAGRVFEAGWCSGYGYCVKIDHGGGLQTVYGHLISQPVVAAGAEVSAGQLIGHMGSTYDAAGGGYSTGNHLHFEVRVNGQAVDPLKFLP